jgi:DNA-binding response OmpR family regulator
MHPSGAYLIVTQRVGYGVTRKREMPKKINILFLDDDTDEFDHLQARMALQSDSGIVLRFAISVDEALQEMKESPIDLLLVDNQLQPHNDFRETVPILRASGFIGPIGVISTDIGGDYFQRFRDFGVDFRMEKTEINPDSLRHITSEYLRDNSPGNADDFLG